MNYSKNSHTAEGSNFNNYFFFYWKKLKSLNFPDLYEFSPIFICSFQEHTISQMHSEKNFVILSKNNFFKFVEAHKNGRN